ncbi:MAG: site-2 protease family protein [Oscillospiraceae bacterium]|nr:site-2 protease family protein [Oscillospiraceae bacterium]
MLFLILPVIQYCKCLVAFKLGDDSQEMRERLSINPLVHLSVVGVISMLFCGIGWTKNLPINSSNFYKVKDRKTGNLIVAFAGPCGCLILSFIFALILAVMTRFRFAGSALGCSCLYVFNWIVHLSVFAAIFSCLPIPGMPGESIGEYFFPDLMAKLQPYKQLIFIGFLFLMFLPVNVAFAPFNKLAQVITHVFYSACDGIVSLFCRA